MYHALINPQGTIDRIEENIDPKVSTKFDWKWLPVVDDPWPVLDANQKKESFIIIYEDRVHKTWIITEKNEEEILKEKLDIINSIGNPILMALLKVFNTLSSDKLTLQDFKAILVEDL